MRQKLLFALFYLLLPLLAQAQKLTVESMEAVPMDLSASAHPRSDRNGTPCALVKVQLAAVGAQFEGNVLGNADFKAGEYWVYMSEGSYMLHIKHPNFIPLEVNFRDYGIRSVEQKTTYILTVLKPSATVAAFLAGIEMGHDWIDLGLSVCWATMNLRANMPSEPGGTFAWGETDKKFNFSWYTYSFCKGSYTSLTKYNSEESYGTIDNKEFLEIEDDAAAVNWGGRWRMPTSEEFEELLTKCKWEWTKQKKCKGYLVTGPNGNSIFLPTCGYRFGSTTNFPKDLGCYWSSSFVKKHPSLGVSLHFGSGARRLNQLGRCFGLSIRPVLDP